MGRGSLDPVPPPLASAPTIWVCASSLAVCHWSTYPLTVQNYCFTATNFARLEVVLDCAGLCSQIDRLIAPRLFHNYP